MGDDAVLAAILEILKHRGVVGISDVTSIPGCHGDIQARRILATGVRRGLLQPAKGGGFVAGGYP